MRVQVKANNSLAIDHFGCILACLSHKLDRGLLVNDTLSTTDLSGRAFTRQACESRLIRFRYMSRRRMPSLAAPLVMRCGLSHGARRRR